MLNVKWNAWKMEKKEYNSLWYERLYMCYRKLRSRCKESLFTLIPWPTFSANQKPWLLGVYDPIYPFRGSHIPLPWFTTRVSWDMAYIPWEKLTSPSAFGLGGCEFLSWYIGHIPLLPRGISNNMYMFHTSKYLRDHAQNLEQPWSMGGAHFFWLHSTKQDPLCTYTRLPWVHPKCTPGQHIPKSTSGQ